MIREEEEEVIKEIIVVEDQKRKKEMRTRLDVSDVEKRIIWLSNAPLTRRDPLPNAGIAGWITQLENAGTDASRITRKLRRRRKIRSSKDCERLRGSLMNIVILITIMLIITLYVCVMCVIVFLKLLI